MIVKKRKDSVWVFGELASLGLGFVLLLFMPAEGCDLESSSFWRRQSPAVRDWARPSPWCRRGLQETWVGKNGSVLMMAAVRGSNGRRWRAAAAQVRRTSFWEILP